MLPHDTDIRVFNCAAINGYKVNRIFRIMPHRCIVEICSMLNIALAQVMSNILEPNR